MSFRGRVFDAVTGAPVAATVCVLSSSGHPVLPGNVIRRMGTGKSAFYCDGEFILEHYSSFGGRRVQTNSSGSTFPTYFSGLLDITIEHGTEYVPLHHQIDIRTCDSIEVDLPLVRWIDLRSRGWYPGNTHIHYDENEHQADDRLRLEPRAHDLSFAALSILEKRGIPYASNKYPAGLLSQFSNPLLVVECGEEARHNDGLFSSGYGHVLFLHLGEYVHPVSRGMLSSDQAPDFPPLTLQCDAVRKQGGVVIWAHNGNGRESPAAAALGQVDAVNLFDYYWMEPEYETWYDLLNCGIHLPASTGSDFFICNNNRVYVQIKNEFSYEAWWKAFLAGRTFITNGPALFVSVDGYEPGDTVDARNAKVLPVWVTWESHQPIHTLDVVSNGSVVGHRDFPDGGHIGTWNLECPVEGDGWIAVRCAGHDRDSYDQPVFAHTSPVYVSVGGKPTDARRHSAEHLLYSIDESLEWINHRGRFDDSIQRETVRCLFHNARAFYENLM